MLPQIIAHAIVYPGRPRLLFQLFSFKSTGNAQEQWPSNQCKNRKVVPKKIREI